jgi:uncharacterized membrane protein YbhN (UPF0104 family)
LRLALRGAVTLGLLGLLAWLARRGDLADAFRSVRPGPVALAVGLHLLVSVLNAWRWQHLLRYLGIRERLVHLSELYFIGQFCSLFLPSSAGGDAVRVCEVARRGHSPWRALLATLQERLIGLGVTMGVGLAATLCFLPLLPPSLRWLILAVQTAGLLAVAALLCPGPLLRLAGRVVPGRARRLAEAPWAARPRELLGALRELPPLSPARAAPVLLLALLSFVVNVLVYEAVGPSLGVRPGLGAYALVVPLVWVVRLLPVSLNGIGVGEGAFVFLVGLFGIPPDRALALALTVLGVQTAVALFGGGLLLLRLQRGTWSGADVPAAVEPEEEVCRAA